MGLENIRMTTGQNELRMMWLISLVIVGLSAWYLDYEIVSYLCGLGFLMSVMQYVNAVQQPLEEITAEHQLSISGYSKVPLYISSLITILWVLLAFATMWIAAVKALKPMWILGGSILVIVTLKLVMFDLSHVGTLTRVLSFLLAGGVMLLIAYVAPMPDGEKRV